MRIFLTGINGFLGSHIAKQLNSAGHEVVGLVRNDFRKKMLSNIPIEYCVGDLIDEDSYKEYIKSCEVVIHAAAITQFEAFDKKNTFLINTDSTKKLLKNSFQSGIKRFIYISTRGTLGVSNPPSSSSEKSGYKNKKYMDAYLLSKFFAEKEVKSFSSQQKKMKCIILSPTAMIGTHDDRPSPIGKILLDFCKGKIKFYTSGGINIVDVKQVASACVNALEKGKNGESYIIGNINISLYNLFKEISLIQSVKLPRIKLPFLFNLLCFIFHRVIFKDF